MYKSICMHGFICLSKSVDRSMYVYLHTYMPAYLNTYMPPYLHTYVTACIHTYIHVYIYTTCAHIYNNICSHTQRTHRRICMYVCMYIYISICIHTYVYAYAHTCIHPCMQAFHIYIRMHACLRTYTYCSGFCFCFVASRVVFRCLKIICKRVLERHGSLFAIAGALKP